jgi:enoyl-CoA hydratase/carnithine racemase
MSYEVKIEDGIVVFSFKRGKINAITQETLQGLEAAVDRLNTEEELKGLVLTGEGRYFSSGFDLGTFTSFKSEQEIVDWFSYEEAVLYKLFTCKKPVIAAVNGHATAAGMILCMACDYRMAVNSPKIKVGMTEIKIGLALSEAQGEIMRFGLDTDKKFRDVIFNGELMTTAQAVEQGIFDELVEDSNNLIDSAKFKVCSLIDTPGRPFIMLKYLEKRHTVDHILASKDWYDWNTFAKAFLDESVVATLTRVKESMA